MIFTHPKVLKQLHQGILRIEISLKKLDQKDNCHSLRLNCHSYELLFKKFCVYTNGVYSKSSVPIEKSPVPKKQIKTLPIPTEMVNAVTSTAHYVSYPTILPQKSHVAHITLSLK